jgi:hypothetical protein
MDAVRGRGPAGPPFPEAGLRHPHELGCGRLEPGIPNGRPRKVLRIDATGAPFTLIGRLLVGSYITGQDQVLVTARGGLTPAQRAEIHRVVDRLLGMSVVGDGPDGVEVFNFIDPCRYELPRLLRRVVELLRLELAACHAAMVGRRAAQLGRIDPIEEEIDQLYLLMARQLLLSSDDPRIARDINVVSHHYQIGYRLVAKVLEVTGDMVQAIGNDLRENVAGLRRMPRPLPREIALRIQRLDDVLARTMAAFTTLSVVEADATLNSIVEALPQDASLAQQFAQRVPDKKVAGAAQRIAGNLAMALEMLVIVNETTINRSVEPETVALTGARVVSSWACEGDPAPRRLSELVSPRPVAHIHPARGNARGGSGRSGA